MQAFFKKYGNNILLILIAIFFLTNLWGKDITKSDWLGFWGSFLAFAGALFLGAVSIWQNEQANETNKKMIEENRRINQIQFENEIIRKKYLIIIDSLQNLSTIIQTYMKQINNLDANRYCGNYRAFWAANKMDMEYFIYGCDCVLPVNYDDEYPQLKTLREKLKERMSSNVKIIEENTNLPNNSPEFTQINDNCRDCSADLISYIALFHKKINSLDSYDQFKKE